MLVLGAGVLPSTFRAAKSVCVFSEEAGPRSRVCGLGEAYWGVEKDMPRDRWRFGGGAVFERIAFEERLRWEMQRMGCC